ncbi:hypothetical protein TVAG_396480 [Trichomonas vaginalis G3]|uniref:Right handed beta helix domain-containing protein n=1 Tax=Trichomonas vaginalis (strain ATCC PRA-98 / G3) TaxID=412133 RepID=A2FYC7_TRIV3|nr:hypothetical protein TVAG_396480 [Trichomonas vaginalis G3]|eukprot:XP_001303021.1 hypothetical protein [Trichomonas vaginalis G3]
MSNHPPGAPGFVPPRTNIPPPVKPIVPPTGFAPPNIPQINRPQSPGAAQPPVNITPPKITPIVASPPPATPAAPEPAPAPAVSTPAAAPPVSASPPPQQVPPKAETPPPAAKTAPSSSANYNEQPSSDSKKEIPPQAELKYNPPPTPEENPEIKSLPAENFTNTQMSGDVPHDILVEIEVPQVTAPPEGTQGTKVMKSINSIIDQANEGDSIVIPEGVYEESLTITKKVHLFGEGNCRIVSDGAKDTISIKAEGATFTNITFLQHESQASRALNANAGSVYFKNCNFSAKFMSTANLVGNSQATFDGCTFEGQSSSIVNLGGNSVSQFLGCTFKGAGNNGLIVKARAATTIKDSNFQDIRKDAVHLIDNCSAVFKSVKVNNVGAHGFLISSESKRISLIDCEITDCRETGISAFLASSLTLHRNTIKKCKTCLEVSDGSSILMKSNRFMDTYSDAMVICFCHANVLSQEDTFSGIGNGLCAMERSRVTVQGGKFENLEGTGAIVFGNEAFLSISSSNFRNIKYSGLQVHTGGSLTVNSCTMTNCTDSGLFVDGDCNARVEGLQVTNGQKVGVLVRNSGAFLKELDLKSNYQYGLLLNNARKVDCQQSSFSQNRASGIIIKNSEKITFNNINSCENNYHGIEFHNSFVSVRGGEIKSNKVCGLVIAEKSDVSANDLTISNSEYGVHITEATGDVRGTTISDCKLGIYSTKAIASVATTSFKKCEIGFSVTGKDCKSGAKNCQFEENTIHLQCEKDSTLFVKECELKNSKSVAIKSSEGYNCEITGSHFSNGTCAVWADTKLHVVNNTIDDFSEVGLYICGGTGDIMSNKITNNGGVGIDVVSGDHKITKNEIIGHKYYGIHIDLDASPAVSNNTFSDNELGNVSRE